MNDFDGYLEREYYCYDLQGSTIFVNLRTLMRINPRILQLIPLVLSLAITTILGLNLNSKALAHSVCGLKREEASFKTKSYLITICPGEASFQLILTYLG
ncbi:hypothetical protein [Gloeothece verrucosa]|uniref:hypothetical protein n=1 Tax=Gloeothece verrucosa TaxID=2546359 RepID=UPI00067412E1|nr:hypothetical protein [Gloeothece verrucosa]